VTAHPHAIPEMNHKRRCLLGSGASLRDVPLSRRELEERRLNARTPTDNTAILIPLLYCAASLTYTFVVVFYGAPLLAAAAWLRMMLVAET